MKVQTSDSYLWVLQDGACQSNALLLPARHLRALLASVRVVPANSKHKPRRCTSLPTT